LNESPDHTRRIELRSDTSWYTLEPLRTEGRDALQLIPGIRKIRLRELEIRWRNAPDDITIRKADDLFERAAAVASPYGPIPAKAILARATFDLELENSTRPLTLTILPPDTIIVGSCAEVNRSKRLLELCRIRVCRAILLALLALAGAMPTDEDDDADDEHSRWHGPSVSVAV